MTSPRSCISSADGTSLVEVLVGLTIGLIAVATILATFAGAEGLKRNTTGAADAQNVGALAAHTLRTEVANAGHGLAAAARELATCPDTGDIRTTSRPVPVLITAGASDDASDTLVVNYASSHAPLGAVALASTAPAGTTLRARNPLGFAVDDVLVAIGLDGRCGTSAVTSVSTPDGEGVVSVTHTGLAESYPQSSLLVDLGPRTRLQRTRYDVVDATLRSLDLTTAGAVANPQASNVVLLKAQYGVDADGDGHFDTWVGAGAAPWNPTSVLAAPASTLAAIKAVRVGLIVRSDVWDRNVTSSYRWVLFDCADDDKARCPGRLTGTLPAKWRYRVIEMAVPLVNQIWNVRP